MPGNSLLIGGSCIAVLVLLAVRAVLRLSRERSRGDCAGGCSAAGPPGDPGDPGVRTRHRAGEASHLAMAVGMTLMFLPFRADRPALAVLFGGIVLFAATVWVTDQVRSARARRRRRSGEGQRDRPYRRRDRLDRAREHRLEPHHVIVGSAMVVMALRTPTAAAGMAAMPGMALGTGGGPGVVWLTLSGYVWLSVLVLGAGLARAFRAEAEAGAEIRAEISGGAGAMLGAPTTVYACELAMTVVMGLMLLS